MIFETIDATLNGDGPLGTHQAKFVGLDVVKTTNNECVRFMFETLEGAKINALATKCQPNSGNKLGKFLGNLIGKPCTGGLKVNADDYIGKPYLCIIQDEKGKPKLTTFTQL